MTLLVGDVGDCIILATVLVLVMPKVVYALSNLYSIRSCVLSSSLLLCEKLPEDMRIFLRDPWLLSSFSRKLAGKFGFAVAKSMAVFPKIEGPSFPKTDGLFLGYVKTGMPVISTLFCFLAES